MLFQTPRDRFSRTLDLGIALLPAFIWAIFLFGGRAAVLMLLCGISCALIDIPLQYVQHRTEQNVRQHCALSAAGAFLTGVLTAFWFPPTVPLWMPLLAAVPVEACRCVSFYFGKRPLNASVFSAFLMRIAFSQYMTRFTRPFAYFPVFPAAPDEQLVEVYRVHTPLDILQAGKLYEDGMLAELYGFAAGALGAVAIAALLLGGLWLLARRMLSLWASAGYALTVLILAMATAPEDAEMLNYALLYLLCGGIALVGIFGVNDPASTPRTQIGRLLFGILAGALTVLFRAQSGTEGALAALLVANLLSPALEAITTPKLPRRKKKKHSDELNVA